jgi:uncharacterized membrane protein
MPLTIFENIIMSNFSFFIIVLIIFLILISAELLALYLHVAEFTPLEIVLLIAFPLLAYMSTSPMLCSYLTHLSSNFDIALDLPRLFDVPLFHVNDNIILGINLVGLSIPTFISLKMLFEKRIPIRETLFLIALISAITYLYTYFQPGIGIVIYFFAIPPILAAAVSFMLRKIAIERGREDFNPALLSYAGATIGVLTGADILNLYTLVSHHWVNPVFISIGGGGVLDAIFLAGIVALFADLIFRSQEEDVTCDFIRLFR